MLLYILFNILENKRRLLPAWECCLRPYDRLFLKHERRAANFFPFQVDVHLDAIGDFDERYVAVHSIFFPVESHCARDKARASSPSVDLERQVLFFRNSTNREIAVQFKKCLRRSEQLS